MASYEKVLTKALYTHLLVPEACAEADARLAHWATWENPQECPAVLQLGKPVETLQHGHVHEEFLSLMTTNANTCTGLVQRGLTRYSGALHQIPIAIAAYMPQSTQLWSPSYTQKEDVHSHEGHKCLKGGKPGLQRPPKHNPTISFSCHSREPSFYICWMGIDTIRILAVTPLREILAD